MWDWIFGLKDPVVGITWAASWRKATMEAQELGFSTKRDGESCNCSSKVLSLCIYVHSGCDKQLILYLIIIVTMSEHVSCVF